MLREEFAPRWRVAQRLAKRAGGLRAEAMRNVARRQDGNVGAIEVRPSDLNHHSWLHFDVDNIGSVIVVNQCSKNE